MFLVPAEEKGRCEGIESSLTGLSGRAPQSDLVTVAASIGSHEGCLPQEVLYWVIVGFLDRKAFASRILPKRLEALFVLEIGMYVRIEEQPLHVARLLSEDLKRVDRARRTADVEKKFHDDVYLVYLVFLVHLVLFYRLNKDFRYCTVFSIGMPTHLRNEVDQTD